VAAWQDVLEEMIRLRRPALVGYAYLLTGNRSQAEDLVHDALVRTFSRARALTDVRSTEGYVRKAIATTFLNDIRSRRAFTSRQHLLVEPASSPAHDEAVTDAVAVQVALEVLSRRERACIVLRFFEDFTVPEIARALGLADGSVKRYLSDAISRLERILGPTRGLSLDHGSDARIDVEITTRGTR
jgi:RNA polymerase sigma factor (sigma-70 family)